MDSYSTKALEQLRRCGNWCWGFQGCGQTLWLLLYGSISLCMDFCSPYIYPASSLALALLWDSEMELPAITKIYSYKSQLDIHIIHLLFVSNYWCSKYMTNKSNFWRVIIFGEWSTEYTLMATGFTSLMFLDSDLAYHAYVVDGNLMLNKDAIYYNCFGTCIIMIIDWSTFGGWLGGFVAQAIKHCVWSLIQEFMIPC